MKYFGTDGIRGEVGKSLPFERAFQLGYAVKHFFHDKKVMIAYDTRASFKALTQALIQGLESHDVEVLGMFPTPVLAFESKQKDAIGIMITASHNPYTDNGLKLFKDGLKLSKDILQQLEMLMDQAPQYVSASVAFKETKDIKAYRDFLNDLKFVDSVSRNTLFDCANGATSLLVPEIFQGSVIHHKPDGMNINFNCGSTYIEKYIEKKHEHPIIVTYDGDGDRMLAVIDSKVIYGDILLYLLAKDDQTKGLNHKVALSVMTNPGIIKAFQELNIDVVETPVGDSHIIDAIEQGFVSRGAEASGHILTEHITIGDGILASYKLFDLISRQGLDTIRSWLAELTLFPMETKNIHLDKTILKDEHIKKELNTIIENIPKPGKVIVRASGTEDLIRITVSLSSQAAVKSTIQTIQTLLEGGNV